MAFLSIGIFSTLTNFLSGFYLNITRFIGSQTYYKFAKINLIVIFFIYFFGKFLNFRLPSIFSFLKLYIISTSLIFFIRIFIRDLVMKYSKNKNINNSIGYTVLVLLDSATSITKTLKIEYSCFF